MKKYVPTFEEHINEFDAAKLNPNLKKGDTLIVKNDATGSQWKHFVKITGIEEKGDEIKIFTDHGFFDELSNKNNLWFIEWPKGKEPWDWPKFNFKSFTAKRYAPKKKYFGKREYEKAIKDMSWHEGEVESDFGIDMAHNLIHDKRIVAYIQKNYGPLKRDDVLQRIAWDIEAIVF